MKMKVRITKAKVVKRSSGKAHRFKVRRHKIHKYRGLKKLGIISFLIIIFLFFAAIIANLLIIQYIQERDKEIPTPDKVFPTVQLATEIYDRNGELLYRLHNDQSNSDSLSLTEINGVTKAAFMAAEDSDFYNHNGINPDAIFRCLLTSMGGQNVCGASTITQQLIKITTHQKDRTFQTKVDEMLLALRVEKKFSKDQIFEMYLRVTPYGSSIIGLKTAARVYFGVTDLKQLTLAQATVLASIINNPANLSPTLSLDNEKAQELLNARQSYVMDQLSNKLDNINKQLESDDPNFKPITQDQIDAARNEKLTYLPPPEVEMKAGHFVNYVLNSLQEDNYKNGTEPFTLADLQGGGYKIYTTLDYWSETVAERTVWNAGNNYQNLNMYNAALMTITPSNGEIITMAGSKSFTAPSEGCDGNGQNCKFDPQVNVLTTPQSPGSTNKPIGYYEALREHKIYPDSIITDLPTRFGDYVPKDWDGRFIGKGTATTMLRYSRNIPAVKVVDMIGVNRYLDTAKAFGYTSYQNYDNYGKSVILGGAEVYLTEHAQAYGVFANGGDLVRLNPILKIIDRDGNIIYQAHPVRESVADRKAVSQINSMLYRLDTLASPIYWDGRPVAGKTGTTENNRTALLVVYSPDFVTIAWGGNNNNDPMNQTWGWPGFVVTPWVRDYMRELNGGGRFTQWDNF